MVVFFVFDYFRLEFTSAKKVAALLIGCNKKKKIDLDLWILLCLNCQ